MTARIDNIDPAYGPLNSLVTINGSGFGETQSSVNGIVTFDGVSAQVAKWYPTFIEAYTPSAGQDFAEKIDVVVTVNNTASNPVPFTIKS